MYRQRTDLKKNKKIIVAVTEDEHAIIKIAAIKHKLTLTQLMLRGALTYITIKNENPQLYL